jgi:hypothetical protein
MIQPFWISVYPVNTRKGKLHNGSLYLERSSLSSYVNEVGQFHPPVVGDI